ncbi:MAG: glycosyltransferase [Muribaculaceae bacterium]|jgi:glycosyltransferase, group 2 family|nr:glycosyltransferase [Muribaculaceae bacterium]
MIPLISVIVPIFNSRTTLSNCINSILNQSMSDFELILVDDGSTDDSLSICELYSNKDSRIRILQQRNSGVTHARSLGVNSARGLWVCFVDSDDTIPENSLKLLSGAIDDKFDIIIGQIYNKHRLEMELDLNSYRKFCISGDFIHPGPVAKLYRRELFDEKTFQISRDIIRGEDLIMNVRLSFRAKRLVKIIPQIVYNYIPNSLSVMHSTKHTIQHAEIFLQYLELSIPNKFREYYHKEIISNRIKSIENIIYDDPNDQSWRHSSFYKDLTNDMEMHNIKFSLSQRLMLASRNKLSLFFNMKIIRILSFLNI